MTATIRGTLARRGDARRVPGDELEQPAAALAQTAPAPARTRRRGRVPRRDRALPLPADGADRALLAERVAHAPGDDSFSASGRAAIGRMRLDTTRPLRRTVPTGGVLIAFMGPGGSVKSAMARAAATLLAEKLDVLLIYFGSGHGPGSLLRWPLDMARAAAAWLGLLPWGQGLQPASDPAESTTRPAPRGPLLTAALILFALTLALEKRRKLKRAWSARDAGIVVLADRYPQAQVCGLNDGPLLAHLANHRSPVLRWLARLEAAAYVTAQRYPPDLVIKLHVTPEAAVRRTRSPLRSRTSMRTARSPRYAGTCTDSCGTRSDRSGTVQQARCRVSPTGTAVPHRKHCEIWPASLSSTIRSPSGASCAGRWRTSDTKYWTRVTAS